MSATYHRELAIALINAAELHALLARRGAATVLDLATAIGLASAAHQALLRAAKASLDCDSHGTK